MFDDRLDQPSSTPGAASGEPTLAAPDLGSRGFLRSRRRRQPSHPRRTPSLRFRIIEGAVALFCLLLFHQIFWLLMRSPRWESAAGPKSGAYLEGWSLGERLFRSWDTPTSSVETKEPSARIRAFVPANVSAELFVNGLRRRLSGSTWFPFETDIRLRRGGNHITVIPEQNRTMHQEDSLGGLNRTLLSLGSALFPQMKVIYRPKDELEPTVVGVLHVEKSLCEVLGFGEPDSRILVHLGEQTAESETDDMGVFQQYFPEPHQEVVLTLNRISQKEQVPSTPLRVPPGCPGISATSVRRKIDLDCTKQEPELHLYAHIPKGTALYGWIENEEITSTELSKAPS